MGNMFNYWHLEIGVNHIYTFCSNTITEKKINFFLIGLDNIIKIILCKNKIDR